jgi:hypothetical protein
VLVVGAATFGGQPIVGAGTGSGRVGVDGVESLPPQPTTNTISAIQASLATIS